jgi:peptide/nickel transport system ATP-binding protein
MSESSRGRISRPDSRKGGLLSVRQLSVRTRRDRTIVDGIDLHVDRGEALGIVGESGSGKSMTAKALTGLLPAGLDATGEVLVAGNQILGLRDRALRKIRGSEIGLVMQDPFTMLNPLLRVGVQVTDGLRDERRRRLSRSAARKEAVRRLAEVGIRDPDVADRFPFQLSGGMRQRVAIAAALGGDPGLLIADEPSTALDVTTQKEILELLRSVQVSRGMGLVLITHDLRVAVEACDRIHVMYAGNFLEAADAPDLDLDPRHPYTLGLLSSEPPSTMRLKELPVMVGSVPRPDAVAGCCPFAARCTWAQARCYEGQPPLEPVSDGSRLTACLRSEEIHEEMLAAKMAPRESAVVPGLQRGDSLVSVTDLVKAFPGEPKTYALNGVSIEIGQRASVGLLGESGSGKTTLARCILGLESPTSGQILVDGVPAHNFGSLSRRDRALLRHKVQMIFQDPYSSLNPVRTVGATLIEAIQEREPKARRGGREVEHLLHRVGLPAEYAGRKPAALSGGERQRVAIARALAMRPRLIVCDEPVSALDVSVQAQILNLLTELREEYEVSYLFITHDLAVARQIVETVYVLHRGQVVESGDCETVLDRPSAEYTQTLVASVPGANAQSRREGGGRLPTQ